ncbi:LytR/AlgR family response regulator transcription factor [Algoriphagus namhaensis]
MKISSYLGQAYPFYYRDLKKVFIILCIISVMSFLFAYLFEPFEVNFSEHKISSLWIIVIQALIPIPIAMIYFYLLQKWIKGIENWTIGKEFLHLMLILFLIGIVNFFLRDFVYTNPDNWSFRYFWEEIRNTFLVGGLILLIVLPVNLERLLYSHLRFVRGLSFEPSERQSTELVQIETPIPTEQFELNTNQFLFAKVDGNYLEVYNRSTFGLEKQIKRMTLKEFEDHLAPLPFIIKIHRSYLVNLHAIKSISGNAQGYQLQLKDYSKNTIPVSRSHIQKFNRAYAAQNQH